MKNSLTVFEFKKTLFYLSFLITVIFLLLVFFAFALFINLMGPLNTYLVGLIYFVTLFSVSIILGFVTSEFVYHEISEISFEEEIIFVKKNDVVLEEFHKGKIKGLEFHYGGDFQWRAINPRFQEIKSKIRYKRLKRSTYSSELDSFDKIIVNTRMFLVKIKNIEDKEYFYKIIDWANKNGVKNELYETNYYAEYK